MRVQIIGTYLLGDYDADDEYGIEERVALVVEKADPRLIAVSKVTDEGLERLWTARDEGAS